MTPFVNPLPSPRDGLSRLTRSVWLFPAILALLLFLLTAFRISGSSIGTYHQFIYGPGVKDPNLIIGHLQPIRSDEWLVDTQMALAQHEAGYPKNNLNLGTGQDMALDGNSPVKDWSLAFRPQNLAYFVLPFENAFAFKWWFLLFMLIIGCYFFTLRIFENRRLLATLIGLGFGLSPFVFWWYLSGTLSSLFYAFFIMIIGMRIINNEPVAFLKKLNPAYTKLAYIFGLAYLMIAFGLILYPPFQIPVAIVIFFYLFGHLINSGIGGKHLWQYLVKRLSIFIIASIIALLGLVLFIQTNSTAIRALSNTVYPGVRVSTSGHINPLHIFDSFLMPQLESTARGTAFFKNQSEASNFILLSPFLALPALFLTYLEYRQKRRIDWLYVSVQACVLMFFARVFLPFGDRFYNLLFLSRVPNERLVVGIGLASIILTILVLKKLTELKIRAKTLWLLAGIYSLACLGVVAYIGFHVSTLYPKFISYPPKILLLAVGFSSIIFLVLTRRIILAASLLLVFSLGCVMYVNPIYRGLGWITHNDLFSRMEAISPPGSSWAASDVIVTENFPALANRNSISGVKMYPDITFWRQAQGPQYDDIYNRYAHVIFVSSPSWSDQLHLVQPDFFEVRVSCSKFITSNVNYLLDTSPVNQPCLELKDTVTYPAVTFYLYKILPLNTQPN